PKSSLCLFLAWSRLTAVHVEEAAQNSSKRTMQAGLFLCGKPERLPLFGNKFEVVRNMPCRQLQKIFQR
ncbi:MAG TPA: hypothetical protein VG099_20265, partial [Gemmataceae bacterium]|nr:hypothetical protein [Gemmataceae bacterium]